MHPFSNFTRREALRRIGGGFGMVGLGSVLGETPLAASNPLDPKPPHFPTRAKHVIFLFLNGGLSHVDSFDRKPALDKYDGQPFPGGNPKTERKTGNLMKSPFRFQKYGQSGIEVSELFPHVARCIDDVCIIRSMHTDVPNHEPSLLMMNCGLIQPGRPSMGSWLTYGLGTENRNLPGYVVLCGGVPTTGTPLWNSAFLPTAHQGTFIRTNESDPEKLIPFIRSKASAPVQQSQIELLEKLNREHQKDRAHNPQLEGSIHAMEVAFHMQTEALQAFDIGQEKPSVLEQYGKGDFAKGCLMARRLVERGVRVAQVYFGPFVPWDSHEDIFTHQKLALQADQPIAALLNDLKSRGLLDETLVIIGSEFGRTPVIERAPGLPVQNGRDHNSYGFSILLAGGGVKGGMTYGATDEFGFYATEKPVHVHDLHATILHLMGLDHTKLTYRYSGRDFRLTDVHGNVIKEIIV